MADFDRAIAAEPDNTDAVYSRGVSCIHLRRYDDALEAFDQILSVQENHAGASYFKGIVLSRLEGRKRPSKPSSIPFLSIPAAPRQPTRWAFLLQVSDASAMQSLLITGRRRYGQIILMLYTIRGLLLQGSETARTPSRSSTGP